MKISSRVDIISKISDMIISSRENYLFAVSQRSC
jgi:hypothetical protein